MAAATAKYWFRFRICWCYCLHKVKVYQQTKFRRHISIGGWDITTFVFEKQTSAITEIYFRFRFRPFGRNLHIILRQATEFRPYRSTHCGNMPSYPFLKMAAATAEYYFRFHACWCHCLQVKVYKQTKFRRHISIDGWDITTSGFEIQTSAILEFYFRFRSRPVRHNMHVILHQATEFRPNRNTHCGNVISISQDGGMFFFDVIALRRSKSMGPSVRLHVCLSVCVCWHTMSALRLYLTSRCLSPYPQTIEY